MRGERRVNHGSAPPCRGVRAKNDRSKGIGAAAFNSPVVVLETIEFKLCVALEPPVPSLCFSSALCAWLVCGLSSLRNVAAWLGLEAISADMNCF